MSAEVIGVDYEPGDEWDWDQSDDSQHCEHGTFVGSWWGPDVLCHWCEAGASLAEVERIERSARLREATETASRVERLITELCDALGIAKGVDVVIDFCADDPKCVRALRVLSEDRAPMFAVFYASAGCLPDSDLPEYVGTREQCERWMDEHADGYVRPDVEHDLYDLILVDLGEDATPEEVWDRLSA